MEENKAFAKLSDEAVILAVLLKAVLAQQSEILAHLKHKSDSSPDIFEIERNAEETAELVNEQFWIVLDPIRQAFPESRLDELESILELIFP
ncbi:MAG TPA: hypothetical protein VGB02_09100 [Pyrinomonadaceae bacterium]|jgi:hypothetical protein